MDKLGSLGSDEIWRAEDMRLGKTSASKREALSKAQIPSGANRSDLVRLQKCGWQTQVRYPGRPKGPGCPLLTRLKMRFPAVVRRHGNFPGTSTVQV